jgi:hypothetical protein
MRKVIKGKRSGGFKDVLLFQIVRATDVVISQTPHPKRKGIINDVERDGGGKERAEGDREVM